MDESLQTPPPDPRLGWVNGQLMIHDIKLLKDLVVPNHPTRTLRSAGLMGPGVQMGGGAFSYQAALLHVKPEPEPAPEWGMGVCKVTSVSSLQETKVPKFHWNNLLHFVCFVSFLIEETVVTIFWVVWALNYQHTHEQTWKTLNLKSSLLLNSLITLNVPFSKCKTSL